jgi:hypothetical protein
MNSVAHFADPLECIFTMHLTAVETADIFFERVVTKKRGANSRQTIRENIYEENAIPLFPIL